MSWALWGEGKTPFRSVPVTGQRRGKLAAFDPQTVALHVLEAGRWTTEVEPLGRMDGPEERLAHGGYLHAALTDEAAWALDSQGGLWSVREGRWQEEASPSKDAPKASVRTGSLALASRGGALRVFGPRKTWGYDGAWALISTLSRSLREPHVVAGADTFYLAEGASVMRLEADGWRSVLSGGRTHVHQLFYDARRDALLAIVGGRSPAGKMELAALTEEGFVALSALPCSFKARSLDSRLGARRAWFALDPSADRLVAIFSNRVEGLDLSTLAIPQGIPASVIGKTKPPKAAKANERVETPASDARAWVVVEGMRAPFRALPVAGSSRGRLAVIQPHNLEVHALEGDVWKRLVRRHAFAGTDREAKERLRGSGYINSALAGDTLYAHDLEGGLWSVRDAHWVEIAPPDDGPCGCLSGQEGLAVVGDTLLLVGGHRHTETWRFDGAWTRLATHTPASGDRLVATPSGVYRAQACRLYRWDGESWTLLVQGDRQLEQLFYEPRRDVLLAVTGRSDPFEPKTYTISALTADGWKPVATPACAPVSRMNQHEVSKARGWAVLDPGGDRLLTLFADRVEALPLQGLSLPAGIPSSVRSAPRAPRSKNAPGALPTSQRAVKALSKAGPESIPVLAATVVDGSKAALRELALEVLLQKRGAAATEALLGLLASVSGKMRARILSMAGRREAMLGATAAAVRDDNASVRLAAVAALTEVASDAATDALIEAIGLPQPRVRRIAWFRLADVLERHAAWRANPAILEAAMTQLGAMLEEGKLDHKSAGPIARCLARSEHTPALPLLLEAYLLARGLTKEEIEAALRTAVRTSHREVVSRYLDRASREKRDVLERMLKRAPT